jgi:hypothetical protein
MQMRIPTGNGQQQATRPQYDVRFEPHPKLGAPFMVPVVLDKGK